MSLKSKSLLFLTASAIFLWNMTEATAMHHGIGGGGAAPAIAMPDRNARARNPQAAANAIKSELNRIASLPGGSPGQAQATAVLADLNRGVYFGSPAMQAIEAGEDYNRRILVVGGPGGGGLGGGGLGGGGGHGGPGGGHGGGVPLGHPPYTMPVGMDVPVFNAMNTVGVFTALPDPEKQAIADHIHNVFPGLPNVPPPPGRRASLIHAITAVGAYSGAVAAPLADAIEWAFPAPLTKPGTMDQAFFDSIRHAPGFPALHESYQQAIVNALNHDFPTLPLPLLPARTARITATLHALPAHGVPGGYMTPLLEAAIAANIDARFPAIVNPGLAGPLFNAITALPGFSAAGIKQQDLINALHAILNPPPHFGPGRDMRVKHAVTTNGGNVPFANAVVNAVNGVNGHPAVAWVHHAFAPNSQGADAENELNLQIGAINGTAGAPVGGFTPLQINEIAYAVESTQGPLVVGGPAVTAALRKPLINAVVKRVAGIPALNNPPVIALIERIYLPVIDYVKPANMPQTLFNSLKALENIKNLPSKFMANNIFTVLTGIIHPGPVPAFGGPRDLQIRGLVQAVPGVAGIGVVPRQQLENVIIAKFNREYPQLIPAIPVPAGGDGLFVANAITAAVARLNPSFAHRAGEVVNALPGAPTTAQKITAAMGIVQRGDPALVPAALPVPVPAISQEESKKIKYALWTAFANHLLGHGGLAGAGGAAPGGGVPLTVTNAVSGLVVHSGTITAQTANKVGNALHAVLTADPGTARSEQIDMCMAIIDSEQPNLMSQAAIDPRAGGDGTIPMTIKNTITGAIPVPPPPALLTQAALGMDPELYRIITNHTVFTTLHADIALKNTLLNALAAHLVPTPLPGAVNAALGLNIDNAITTTIPRVAVGTAATLRRELMAELQGPPTGPMIAELQRDPIVLAAFGGGVARRDTVINHLVPLLNQTRAHKHASAGRTNDITNWVNATPGLVPAPAHNEIQAIINTINRVAP
jgi:hypothetical protein